jgi:hypothetical protein
MQKFKDFILLNEASRRSKEITKEQFIQLLVRNCYKTAKYCFENKSFLYRGVEWHRSFKFLFVDPTKTKRVSITTKNYYNLIMSHDPQWQKYPSRENSVITSSSEEIADQFADSAGIYIVLPYDGARFGVANDRDIWNIWGKRVANEGGFFTGGIEEFLEEIYKYFLLDSKSKNYSYDYKLFINKCNEFDNNILQFKKAIDKVYTKPFLIKHLISTYIMTKNSAINSFIAKPNKEIVLDFIDSFSSNTEIDDTIKTLIKIGYHPTKQGLYKTLAKLFSPEEGFTISNNIKNVISSSKKKKEIWTDSKCLLVQLDFLFNNDKLFKEVLENLNLKGNVEKYLLKYY